MRFFLGWKGLPLISWRMLFPVVFLNLAVQLQVVNGKNHGYGLPADIWSLGCTVLEMLTRQMPYLDLDWVCSMHVLICSGLFTFIDLMLLQSLLVPKSSCNMLIHGWLYVCYDYLTLSLILQSNRFKPSLGLGRVSHHMFHILSQEMHGILSWNACKLTQLAVQLLLSC